MTLGEKLKSLREKSDLSQRALSRISGLSNDYISKIEAGKVTNIGLETLAKLAISLGFDSAADLQKAASKGSEVKAPQKIAKASIKLWQEYGHKLHESDRALLLNLAERLVKKKA
jgi:transcriptional regulator with XRE-family HTH domain